MEMDGRTADGSGLIKETRKPAPDSAPAAEGGGQGPPLLEMRNIQRHYPGVQALQGVDFCLWKGEVRALLGENGAGKSTLMKILAGAEKLDGGEIKLDGEPVTIKNPHDALCRGVAMVYQELALAPHLSVAENMFLGRLPNRRGVFSRRELNARAREVLDRLQIPLDPGARTGTLSTAQQQMTEIAKALSANVRILILDEPTSSLSENEKDELFRVMGELKKQDVAIVYISHNLEEILERCDAVTVLRDGCNVGERKVEGTSVDELIQMMVGRSLDEMFPKRESTVGEEILRVDKLQVPGKKAPVSFSARAGEVLGLGGLVGAGRTSLMRTLIGTIKPESGDVFVHGEKVKIGSPSDAIDHGIGYLTEDRRGSGIVGKLSVQKNMTLAALPMFASMGTLSGAREREAASEMVSNLRIATPSVQQQVQNLSGGNQQKVVLGRWLVAGVDVLILDEPTRGIDVGAKIEVYKLVNQLVEEGKTVLMVSSYLPELLAMSDRILVMHGGEITGEFGKDEATQEKVMYAATGQQDGRSERTATGNLEVEQVVRQ